MPRYLTHPVHVVQDVLMMYSVSFSEPIFPKYLNSPLLQRETLWLHPHSVLSLFPGLIFHARGTLGRAEVHRQAFPILNPSIDPLQDIIVMCVFPSFTFRDATFCVFI